MSWRFFVWFIHLTRASADHEADHQQRRILIIIIVMRKNIDQYHAELNKVLTIPEICAAYFVTRGTVYYWIDRGYIEARYAGIWLVSATSLEAYRGKPPNFCATAQHPAPTARYTKN